jgi:hypothetical protein
MFDLFKKLFAPNPTAGDVWAVMKKMDPCCRSESFRH